MRVPLVLPISLAFLCALALPGCGGGGGGSSSPTRVSVSAYAPAGSTKGTFGGRTVAASFSGSTLSLASGGSVQSVDFSQWSPTGVGRVRLTPSLLLVPCDQGVLALGPAQDAAGAYTGARLLASYRLLGATDTGAVMATDQGSLVGVRKDGSTVPIGAVAAAGVVSASAAGNVAAYVLEDGKAWAKDLSDGSAPVRLSDAPHEASWKEVVVAESGALALGWVTDPDVEGGGQGGVTFFGADRSTRTEPTTLAYGGFHLTAVSGDGRYVAASPDGTEEFAVLAIDGKHRDAYHSLIAVRQDLRFPDGIAWLNGNGTAGRAVADDGVTYEFTLPPSP